MGRLAGKRALLTGAGGLLGSELALAFASEGADLILTTRTAQKLEKLAAEIRALGVRVATVGADFTRDADALHLADAAWDAFGGIDVVLLSSQPEDCNLGTLLETPDDVWEDQQKAIVWGPFKMLRKLAPKMMSAGGGSIISLTSSTGYDPVEGYGAYGVAKAGLWAMTLYMAREWGKGGIRANAMQPGTVVTGGDVEAWQEKLRKAGLLARTSLGRVGRSSDCLGIAIYLASDESAFTSGQRIAINGGRF